MSSAWVEFIFPQISIFCIAWCLQQIWKFPAGISEHHQHEPPALLVATMIGYLKVAEVNVTWKKVKRWVGVAKNLLIACKWSPGI